MHEWRPDDAGVSDRPGRVAGPIAIALGSLVVAALVAALDASRNYVSTSLSGRPFPWMSSFSSTAPSWLIAGLLAPLPLLLVGRMPVDRWGWRLAIPVHLAGALAFAAVHVLAVSSYMSWQSDGTATFATLVAKTSSLFIADLLLYAAIAGGAHALRFSREARAREVAASRLQASLTEARLAALRGQLNPHFLFNTLNAISTMALEGDRDRVVRTLGFLADLLRVSLDDQRPHLISLDEELEVLETYLDIQRTRLGDRLTVRVDIEPGAREALVPGMLLQPLVENAITHGIGRKPGPGTIEIHARRKDDSLQIDVSDSGPGFEAAGESRPGAVADGDGDGRPGGGIGLANTRARLAQLYGSRQQLSTGRGEQGGARVTVTLPWQRASSAGGADA
jgi:hypothetical protein